MTNKEIAETFLKLAASDNVREAYDRFVHADFKHHNVYFKGDRESLLLAMEQSAASSPNKIIKVVRALEDGDLVATHSQILRAEVNAPEISVVHIFRFADGKIIEEWETGQELPKDAPNENGAF